MHKRIGPCYSAVNSHSFKLYAKVVACSTEMEGGFALERIFSGSEEETSDGEMFNGDEMDTTDCARVSHGLDLCLVSYFDQLYRCFTVYKTFCL